MGMFTSLTIGTCDPTGFMFRAVNNLGCSPWAILRRYWAGRELRR
jgi:hypothetical protein